MRIYLSIPFGSYLYLLHLLKVSILDVVILLCAAVVGLLLTSVSSALEALGTSLRSGLAIHLGRSGLHCRVQAAVAVSMAATSPLL